jgi:hypothetical protein
MARMVPWFMEVDSDDVQSEAEGHFQMKISHEELTRKTIKALRTCLTRVPFLRFGDIIQEPAAGATRPDFPVKLAPPGGQRNW